MTKYSKDGHRLLSRFHAEEMLYEFATSKLDPVRHKLVKEALEQEPTLVGELARIQSALRYCEELSGWPVTQKEAEALKPSTASPIDVIIEKTRIQHWPSGLRLGLESLVVVTAIFLVAIMVPWNRLLDAVQTEKGTFTITEIHRDFRTDGSTPAEITAADKLPLYDDEGFPEDEAKRLGRPVAESMGIVPQISGPPAPIKPEISEQPVKAVPREVASAAAAKVVTKIEPSPAAVPPTPAPPVKTAKNASKIEIQNADESDEESVVATEGAKPAPTGQGSSATKGFLYRGRVDVTNVEAVTPKLVQFIDGLGGRKAGNVPLGWKSDAGGSYFHLTLPGAKFEDLKKALKEYGPLKLEKHSHSRVMPEGIIRLIIEVKEKKPSGKNEQ